MELSTDLYSPPDNDDLRRQYEPRYGICGPACIAAAKFMHIRTILTMWPSPIYKGYTSIKELKAIAEKLGFNAEWKKGGKAKHFPTPSSKLAICRISWLKPDGTEYYWKGAPSHFVLLKGLVIDTHDKWFFYCNAHGWLDAEKDGPEYLKNGYIGSWLKLERKGNDSPIPPAPKGAGILG